MFVRSPLTGNRSREASPLMTTSEAACAALLDAAGFAGWTSACSHCTRKARPFSQSAAARFTSLSLTSRPAGTGQPADFSRAETALPRSLRSPSTASIAARRFASGATTSTVTRL